MNLYKLTDEHDRTHKPTDEHDDTHNRIRWGPDIEHTASGKGKLNGPTWIHAYTDPLLAVLLNPIHAGFTNPHLWEAEGDVGKSGGWDLINGCTRLKTIRRCNLPVISYEQKIQIGILCGLKYSRNTEWCEWAKKWLGSNDRSRTWASQAWLLTFSMQMHARRAEKDGCPELWPLQSIALAVNGLVIFTEANEHDLLKLIHEAATQA